MNEIVRTDEIPSTSKLSKMGVSAVGYTAAGIFLLILGFVTQSFIPAFIIGGLVLLFGIGSYRSKDLTDKKAGIVLIAAGALTILSKIPIPVIQPLSNVILSIGAVGLLLVGIVNGVKFFRGLKMRS